MSGKASDKVKENELIIVFGYIVMGTGFLLYTIVNSIWFLLLIQVLIGFGEAVYSPAFNAIYSKHLDKKQAGKQWGAWESLNYFTATAGALIGGVIATNFGFTALFMVMAILSLTSAIYIFFLPRQAL